MARRRKFIEIENYAARGDIEKTVKIPGERSTRRRFLKIGEKNIHIKNDNNFGKNITHHTERCTVFMLEGGENISRLVLVCKFKQNLSSLNVNTYLLSGMCALKCSGV